MLQAGHAPDLRVWLSLSGVTPGERKEVLFSSYERCCAQTQSCSHRVRLVGAFRSFIMDFSVLEALAHSLLAGEPTTELLFHRCSRTLGRQWRWLRPLADRYVKKFGNGTRPRFREVIQFLRNDPGLRRAQLKYSDELVVPELVTVPQQMLPVPAAEGWDLPIIETPGDLAAWLGLDAGELRWFADLKGLGYKKSAAKLRHYHYRILAKRFGSIRLIEAPKPRLKDLQLQILRWILEKIPSHPAVHGFLKGRSIRTFVSPHVGHDVVLRMDLTNFFPSFAGIRIQSLFRTLGYPEKIADLLAGICTNAAPRDLWNEMGQAGDPASVSEARRLYSRPHLPQGAPTSPALANICCYRLDCRLSALAKSAGSAYTR